MNLEFERSYFFFYHWNEESGVIAVILSVVRIVVYGVVLNSWLSWFVVSAVVVVTIVPIISIFITSLATSFVIFSTIIVIVIFSAIIVLASITSPELTGRTKLFIVRSIYIFFILISILFMSLLLIFLSILLLHVVSYLVVFFIFTIVILVQIPVGYSWFLSFLVAHLY